MVEMLLILSLLYWTCNPSLLIHYWSTADIIIGSLSICYWAYLDLFIDLLY